MRFFSANYIFPISGKPIKNGIVCLDRNSIIQDVIDPKGQEKEYASMEFYNGVLVPGFINTHCHLELSHLKGRLEQSKGLAGFIAQVRELRRVDPDEAEASIKQAVSTLELNGTVAVGDICNTKGTLSEKVKSDIYFHNFIELFGLNPIESEERLKSALDLLDQFKSTSQYQSSLVPHSPYSISDSLWSLIHRELAKNPSLVSIHYGESIQEYTFLRERSGLLADSFNSLGIPIKLPDCCSPLGVVKRFIPKCSKAIFVHNTYSTGEEIHELISHFANPYFVLCPSSNLFIEGKLPNLPALIEQSANIALGTDSFASSNTLSVFDQILILLENFPLVNFADALEWSTLNGAKALNIESRFGSFEVGKQPGVNLITNFDFNAMKPTTQSRVRRLA